jgi:hypothetical protein
MKIDPDGKIWYLWASHLQFSQRILKQFSKNPTDDRQETEPIDLEEKLRVINPLPIIKLS